MKADSQYDIASQHRKHTNKSGFYSSVVTCITPEQSTNEIAARDLHVSSIEHRITVWGYGRGEVNGSCEGPSLLVASEFKVLQEPKGKGERLEASN